MKEIRMDRRTLERIEKVRRLMRRWGKNRTGEVGTEQVRKATNKMEASNSVGYLDQEKRLESSGGVDGVERSSGM